MRVVDRRPVAGAPTSEAVAGATPPTDPRGRARARRRLPLLVAAIASLALLAFAPGALASTLTYANGTLTYQATPPSGDTQTDVAFGQSNATASSVEVRTFDSDPITGSVPANCTSTPTSSGSDTSDYTCTGVSSVVANAASGVAASFSGLGDQYRATPVINPLTVPITENGSSKADNLVGGDGNDTINGNGGNDYNLDGGPGSDTINGDTGNVTIYGDGENYGYGYSGAAVPGGDNDVINAGSGDVTIYPSNGTNKITGGSGVDQVIYYDQFQIPSGTSAPASYAAAPVTVDLSGKADSGYAGNNSTITGVQDASVQDLVDCTQFDPSGSSATCATGNATISGGSQPGILSGGGGNDTINAGIGGDFIFGGLGNNTVNAVNGYPDRVDCGGTGTANVDQFDSVYRCTTVNRSTAANIGLAAQDPTVTWTAPAQNAKLHYGQPTTLSATVTPSTHPIAQVVFYVGQRVVCTVKTAPYQCSYTPAKQDIGNVTLIAVAQDTSGLTGTSTRSVNVNPYNGALQLKGSRLTVRKGKVSAKFKCNSSLPCVFRFSIVIHGKLAKSHKTATIVFTKSSTGIKTIKAGRTVTETAGVTKAALTILEHARGHSIKGKLSTRPRTPQAGIISIVTLVLKR